eukprot:COSAG04_NODE_604_length_12166_cov_7.767465_8_plen_722_part_00
MKNYSASYKILKSLDPFHPAFGAIQCPRSWEFLDGPGSRGDGPGFDVPMHENYDPSFPGHAGQGPRAKIEQALGDMPLRSYPVEHEPIVNCPWGESTQYYLFAPRVEGGAGPMGGVPVAPMSPDGLRGIGWLGTVYDLHDVLWYTYNKLGSGSPGPKDRLAAAASQLAFEMKEIYPSLTSVKDGTVPRAVATAVTSSAELQPWVKARAWAEPPAPGTTGTVSTGDWNPVTGIDPGMCKPNGQTQTVGTPCATSAVCVHILVANTAPHAATTAVQVKIVDRFGRDTGQLAGSLHATLPFAGFESGEMLPVRDGLFSDTVPAFSVRMFRLGCGAPPIDVGNLVPNPSFEDGTITGAVASWGLFAQHEQRDQRVMLTSDTAHKRSGRHSARLVLPTEHPGGAVTYQGQLAVPFSLGGGQASPDCGNGYQGFYLPAGFHYNISIWARSDDLGMNVSIASGRWAASVASRIFEYTGKPQVSLAPLTQSWTQLSWQHSANTTECLQLLVAGRGQINLDDAFISRAPLPSKMDDEQGARTQSTCLTSAVCGGGALCRPLSPQPKFAHEVVAYHSDGAYGSNGSEYTTYDWSKVTAIADYSWLYQNETICTAHLHGVRVLGFNMYDQGPLNSAEFYTNESWMDAWIAKSAQFTHDRGMDGMMLDIEGLEGKNVTAAEFARFGCKLRQGLHALIPGAVLTWSVSLFADKDGAQAAAIVSSACAADFLTLM